MERKTLNSEYAPNQHISNMKEIKPPQFDQHDYESIDSELNINQSLHLVPCRWERSGWRYVQVDPAD